MDLVMMNSQKRRRVVENHDVVHGTSTEHLFMVASDHYELLGILHKEFVRHDGDIQRIGVFYHHRSTSKKRGAFGSNKKRQNQC